jgi:hypothetical protein
MAGVLLRRTKAGWKVIEQTATTDDFWGVTFFKEQLYLSNYEGVFLLEEKDLSKARVPSKLSTAYLDSNSDVVWSVGRKHLAYSEDGNHWHKLQSP